MAAIEKVCEFSGDYPGWLMYDYKRNHIQIMPEYRKLFKGKKAELIFFKLPPEEVLYMVDRNGPYKMTDYLAMYERIGGKLYRWVEDTNDPTKEFLTRVSETRYYEYALVVPDLPGQVKGIYMNWSYDKGAVLRKMKRLIGRNLVIKKSSLTYWDWRESITR